MVGTVGAGKTSLLSAVLGEVDIVSGNINTQGQIAYVPQQPWIQHCTLKSNIIFGKEVNTNKYRQVLDDCALTRDLDILPAGDQTEIGEKGINLSGGQKQRVSLARAVYSDADLYLLDDPLSAVDSHVGKHIFDHVIGPNGALKNHTRFLVTHGISFLKETDHIIVLENGTISEQGSYEDLTMKNGNFAKFLLDHAIKEDFYDDPYKKVDSKCSEVTLPKIIKNCEVEKISDSGIVTKRSGGNQSNDGILVQIECVETGGVKNKVYYNYAKAIGPVACCFCIIFQILWTGSSKMANYWLDLWTKNEFQHYDSTFYLGVYGGLGGLQAIFNFALMFLFGISSLNGARLLHEEMLISVMKSPVSFFDTTPIGRIVNRFSKDVDVCDGKLPQNMTSWLNAISGFIGTMISIVTVLPVLICLFLPACIIFGIIQKLYVATSRQLKRLESVSRSPIYSQFGETIDGIITVRAFGCQDELIRGAVKKDIFSIYYFD